MMANNDRIFRFMFRFLIATVLLSGCQSSSPQDTKASSSPSNRSSISNRTIAVDVAIAQTENSLDERAYIGTTEPNSVTVLRSQVSGRLLSLDVIVGDAVKTNQVIGRLDDSLLAATVQQEKGELASLESELAKEQLNVKNAQISLEESKIQLEQAESDARRYSSLSEIGAISQQQAESFQTAAEVARQAVLLAEEEVNIARQAVTTASGRVAAQQAAIAEAIQRQAYSAIVSPVTGVVVSKNQEPGNLIQEGEEILSIGDLDAIKVSFPVSPVDLNLVELGQPVKVELDAIHGQTFKGKVTRISPVANTATRKIPIEITAPNSDNKIKSGLLARVKLPNTNQDRVSVPQSAIVEEAGNNYIFVVNKENTEQRQAEVNKKLVEIDRVSQNRVFIAEGLAPGERYIIRSSEPLEDNQVVNLSILSE